MSIANDAALLVLRLALAVVMFPHGAQKMLGWFGGDGFAGTLQFFTGSMHLPAPIAVLPILVEFFGPLLLVLGLLTRLVALAFAVELAVAVVTVHLANGFFANWTNQQKGEGIEYFVLAIAIALALLMAGAGRWAIDASVFRRRRRA